MSGVWKTDISGANQITGVYYLKGTESTDGSQRLIVTAEDRFGIEKRTDGVWNLSETMAGPETIYVGHGLSLSAAGHHISTSSPLLDTKQLVVQVPYDNNGTEEPKTPILAAKEVREITHSDDSGEITGTTIAFSISPAGDQIVTKVYYQTGSTAATQPVHIVVYNGTDATGDKYFDRWYPAETFEADTEIEFLTPGLSYEDGAQIYAEFISLADISLKADAGNTQPWRAADRWILSHDNLPHAPAWEEKTYTVDDIIIESGYYYKCIVTGAQTGTFASNIGKWKAYPQSVPNHNAGILGAMPALTDNENGTISLPGCDVVLYPNGIWSNEASVFTLSSATNMELTDDDTNYVIASYNSGSPEYQVTLDVSIIEESSIIPVYTIFREGDDLHVLSWDRLSNGLPNRLHARLVKTQRFAHQNGIGISESGTRTIQVSEGIIWHGASIVNINEWDSSITPFFWHKHVSGVWTKDITLNSYPNTLYDDGTDIQTLSNNRYVPIWLWLCVEETPHIHMILGGEYKTSELAASESIPSNLPEIITSHAVLLGRLIVKEGAATAYRIQSAFEGVFSATGICGIRIIDSDGDTSITTEENEDEDKIRFTTAGQERAIITNAGKFGVGTSAPDTASHVDSNDDNGVAISTLENTAGKIQIFRVDATPESSIVGSIGDIASDSTNGILYLKDSGSATNTGWQAIGGVPSFKSYSLSNPGNAGTFYVGGHYAYAQNDGNLTIGGTVTQTFGTAGQAHGAHAFIVAAGPGGTDLVLTVTGVSIMDDGTRNDADSEIIVADTDTATTNQYFETTKKWLGQITYTLTGSAGSFDFNYGFVKYEDFGNRDFTIIKFEGTGESRANETGLNIELLHHEPTAFIYDATSFIPNQTALVSLATDYGTNNDVASGDGFAYKRSGLSTTVNGSSGDGIIIRVTTAVNNSINDATFHIGVNLK